SEKMLEQAAEKIKKSGEGTKLMRADVQNFGFSDNSIDTVVTSCTFCSVPDPVKGLKELLRVLKPGGKMLMFEHVRSNISWMGPMLDILTVFMRRVGPELNRDTRGNILKAGFRLTREVNVHLDMVKLFEAEKP
ncbi:MAG TPA: methyltransferase domain-containing protein, partial [Nitrospiria bacterium]|nr:methyltransferase domain-containing protein [Nitrospiria bacterium]